MEERQRLTLSAKKKRKKILYIINRIDNSGPNEVLTNMIAETNHEKFEVIVLSYLQGNDRDRVERLTELLATCICLGLTRKIDILKSGPALLKAEVSRIKPDIIHTHGVLADISTHKAKLDCTQVVTVHNNIFEDYRYSFGPIVGPIYAWWHIYHLRSIKNVVCCSEASLKAVKRMIPNGKFVRNGIDGITLQSSQNSRNTLRSRYGIGKHDKVYIYVGTLSKRKNVLSLIQMFLNSRGADEHLVILGDGELYNECKKYTHRNLHVLGHKDNIEEYLGFSDIYISASKSEGLSISIIQALSCGLHLLISDIPSHREILEIDSSSYIGEVFTAKNFENKKEKLLKQIQGPQGPIAYQTNNLSAASMMAGYEKIYMENFS